MNWLPCWLPRDRQVLHSEVNLRWPLHTSDEAYRQGDPPRFETQARHHQNSTAYDLCEKDSYQPKIRKRIKKFTRTKLRTFKNTSDASCCGTWKEAYLNLNGSGNDLWVKEIADPFVTYLHLTLSKTVLKRRYLQSDRNMLCFALLEIQRSNHLKSIHINHKNAGDNNAHSSNCQVTFFDHF